MTVEFPSLDHFGNSHELPQLYWDVMSGEQRIHAICKALQDLADAVSECEQNNQLNGEKIKELQELFQKFMDSGFDDYYAEQVAKWIDSNLKYIYDKTIKQVFFGLTSDGYFCAYIPESWADIEFDTGMQYGTYTYGRLILRFNADGSGVIDNSAYGEHCSPEEYKSLLYQIREMQKTLYTILNPTETTKTTD